MRALYAIDLNEPEVEQAVGLGRSWLERLGARVDLLYVDRPLSPILVPSTNPELPALISAAMGRREEELRRTLAELAAGWPARHRGSVEVAIGTGPAEIVVDRAASHDVVATGTHGRRGLSRAWLGSIAEKVVRTSPVPVLVVRQAAPPGPQVLRVLVAVHAWDPGAVRVIAEAGRWSEALGATADVLHVVSMPASPDALGDGHSIAAWFDDAEKAVDRIARMLPPAVRPSGRAAWGEPSAVVVAFAKDYDLVVVGTHGRTGLGRLWLGSVAERIVRRTDRTVLVVPTVP